MDENQDSSGDNAETPKEERSVKHVYYEVENDLLSKPNALTSILICGDRPKTVVFCNSPSEADMVTVMLGKADIKVDKLIGNVPHSSLIQACSQIADGTIQALVVTDVAAAQLESKDFDLVVNYSIHDEPEIYIHRSSGLENSGRQLTVASLISPLDFGNFHYLKKVVDFEIEKAELASSEELVKMRVEAFIKSALEAEVVLNDEQEQILTAINEHADKDKLVKFLAYKTLVELPDTQSRRPEKRKRDRYNSKDDSRGSRDDYRDEKPKRDRTPPKKDVRFYIGHGKEESFSEEALTNILNEYCAELNVEIKRISVRDLYSFADFDEEVEKELLEQLGNAEYNGKNFVCYNATKITRPREESEGANDSEESTEDTGGEAKESVEKTQAEAENQAV